MQEPALVHMKQQSSEWTHTIPHEATFTWMNPLFSSLKSKKARAKVDQESSQKSPKLSQNLTKSQQKSLKNAP